MSDKMLSFNESGFQFAWDSTSISNFVTCPRKYLYSQLEGWQSTTRSVHLIFGGHYASALEMYHKLSVSKDGGTHDERLRKVVRKLLEDTWDREAGKPQDWLHASKTRDTLVRSVVWYLEHFRDDAMVTVQLANGAAAVELSFSFELNEEYLYCGHIDRLVHYADGVYVQDQKTTGGSISASFFNSFSPDYQMTGYTLAGNIIFGSKIAGVVVDAARIAVGFTEFGRGFVPRQPAVIEEFREEVIHYIEQAKDCHESGYYPMNRKSCGNFGGCEFAKVCGALPVHRKALLQAGFSKRDRWDPLKRR
jgi:CRISPR/Cas system-associated exonuclease Cas4 (RecB family)